jgi:hypothetical protein
MCKSLLFLLLLILSAVPALAQETPTMGPPKVLLIVREEIKPGMMGTHGRHAADFVGIFNQLQTPNHRIAMVPIAGNENEVLYITPAESFADIERINKSTDQKLSSLNGTMRVKLDALDREGPALHSGMRDMMAVYRPDLSFNPGVDVRKMRYFMVTTTRLRPGFDSAYLDYIQKLARIAREKGKADNYHLATFQVVAGAPSGTYLTMRPLMSLSELDDPVGMRVRAAMSDDQRKDFEKGIREMMMSSETSAYAFAPNMSYVHKEFAAGDPDFWTPKPPMAAKPKPKKRAPKQPPAN